MILRAIIIWFILMVIAIVNGAFRGAVLIPKFGELIGRIISTLLLCALILLMIIVQLLNIIFWWLPFFKICLPLKLSR